MFEVTSYNDIYLTMTRTIKNKAILLFFAEGSWTEVFDGNIIVLNNSASAVESAKYSNKALECRSIFTTERIKASGGYEMF